jgi:hypothetical protein
MRDGKAIKGATKRKYKLDEGQQGPPHQRSGERGEGRLQLGVG